MKCRTCGQEEDELRQLVSKLLQALQEIRDELQSIRQHGSNQEGRR